jgi:YhcH/YjgK/YiaL family protein
MIVDKIENLGLYAGVLKGISGLDSWIRQGGLAELPTGRHDLALEVEGAYALVFEYETKPAANAFTEAHRRYVDVHIILDGAEQIGIRDINECVVEGYDEEKDFVNAKGSLNLVTLEKGCFAVIFPHEVHATGINIDRNGAPVRKSVVKIPNSLT